MSETASDKNNQKKNYKNWKPNTDSEGVLWLHLDQANSSTNVLNIEVLEELEDILLNFTSHTLPIGIIFVSDKTNGFIAGADVKEFLEVKDSHQAEQHILRGQKIMDSIEALNCPTVALIHGFCMGGGFELALACDYRIADDGPKTRLSLPEVQLGIHPGFGGTVRLPRLIGAPAAMDLMLTGKPLVAKKAKKLGAIDHAVPTRHLKSAAIRTIMERPKKHKPSTLQKLTNHTFVRPLLAKMMRKKVAKKARIEHYPAPYAIIDLWASYFDKPSSMLQHEAKSLAQLVMGDTSQNLIRVFFLRDKLKTLGKGGLVEKPFKTQHVHVIGAGVMGGDIAAWCALQGLQVTLQDRSPEVIGKAIGRAFTLFSRKLHNPLLVTAAMDRLLPDMNGTGIPKADVVIEAIIENIEAKQSLFREIEPRMKKSALLTTNTSSIPLEELCLTLDTPSRLVGLHFFNPVAQMPLIEIVSGKNTDTDIAQKTTEFATQIDRLPIPVKSGPGFLVNRILMPYMLEAVKMKEEGVPADTIDKAALNFGMPMGPLHLADTVGLDICLHVAEILAKDLEVEVPNSLRTMVGTGQLGVKSGQGFYHYKKGKKEKSKKEVDQAPDEEMVDRMMGRMINEAVACLREGVVDNADLLDAGIIFGTGFAPFRGGPLNYANTKGYKKFVERLARLESSHGSMFKPDEGWSALSAAS